MNNCALIGVGLGLTVLISAPVSAQQAPPIVPDRPNSDFQREFDRRLTITNNPEKAADTYSQARTIADCLMSRNGAQAVGLVGGEMTDDPDYGDIKKALRGDDRTCVKDAAAGSPALISAALAEKLIVADGEQYEDRAMKLDLDAARAFYQTDDGKPTLNSIARCVAVYSPGLVRKVFDTQVGTASEGDKLDEVFLQTPECGLIKRPDGVETVFQRSAMATGLYEWTHRSG